MNMRSGYLRRVVLMLVAVSLTACTVLKAQGLPAATPEPAPTAGPTRTPEERVLWGFTTGGAIWGEPLLAQGRLYFGSDDGNVYAVDAAQGTLGWIFETGGIVRSRPAMIEDAGIVFTSDDGFLYAVNAMKGNELWRTAIGNVTAREVRENSIGNSTSPTGYDYVQSSPVVVDGRIYVGSADGKVYALEAKSGAVLWSYQTGERVRATPTLAEGVVHVGSWDKTMIALDAETGALLWETKVWGQVQSTALVVEGVVYSASRKASVVALDAATGELLWEYMYGGNMWVESSPVLVGENIYIGSSGSKALFGLDRKTGEVRMLHFSNAFCWSRPLIVEETGTFAIGCTQTAGSPSQGLLVYDLGPHPEKEGLMALTERWQLSMGDGVDVSGMWRGAAGAPIHAEGVVYFGGLDGVLYAVGE
jgi:eukaryotic-like serine/threonine-protein kinase